MPRPHAGDPGPPPLVTPPEHPRQPKSVVSAPQTPSLCRLPAQPLHSGSLHLVPASLDQVSPPCSRHPQGQAQTLQCGLSSLPSSLSPLPLCLPPQAGPGSVPQGSQGSGQLALLLRHHPHQLRLGSAAPSAHLQDPSAPGCTSCNWLVLLSSHTRQVRSMAAKVQGSRVCGGRERGSVGHRRTWGRKMPLSREEAVLRPAAVRLQEPGRGHGHLVLGR